MTEAELTEIEQTLEHQDFGEEGYQSSEELREMANDLGQLTNPVSRIAASLASECLRSRERMRKLVYEVQRLRAAGRAALEGK
jgi:hypothetical protein